MKKINLTLLLVVSVINSLLSQARPWTGRVTNGDNSSLPNISFIIQTYGLTAISNNNGEFTFQIPGNVQSGSRILISLNSPNWRFANQQYINDAGISMFLPNDLDANPIPNIVLERNTRITITDPSFNSHPKWSDPEIRDWLMRGTGPPPDLEFPISGHANNTSANSSVKLSVIVLGQEWDQGTFPVDSAGNWQGTIRLRTTDGDKYKKTIRVHLLDTNRSLLETKDITIQGK